MYYKYDSNDELKEIDTKNCTFGVIKEELIQKN